MGVVFIFLSFFFCCLLPVACTSSHTACTEPKPPHIPSLILLKVFVLREAPCVSVTRSAQLFRGRLTDRAKCALAERVYIFKMDFVQESCFYWCAAVFSLFNSHGGKSTGSTGKTRMQKYPNVLRWTSVSESRASLLQPHMYFVFFPLMYNLKTSFLPFLSGSLKSLSLCHNCFQSHPVCE